MTYATNSARIFLKLCDNYASLVNYANFSKMCNNNNNNNNINNINNNNNNNNTRIYIAPFP